MLYSKSYLSLPNQLSLLKRRGLQVADDAAAEDCLHRNGYYRLSAYWYPFREINAGRRSDIFLPNSHFENAVKLYSFDKQFKLLLLMFATSSRITEGFETRTSVKTRNYLGVDRCRVLTF